MTTDDRPLIERADGSPMLEVTDLSVVLSRSKAKPKRVTDGTLAVDRVSFSLNKGETLGIVGESGSGKTSTARALLRLAPIFSGSVRFQGVELAGLSERKMRAARRELQMVFQDPFGSLDPRMTVGEAIAEPLVVHKLLRGREREARVAEILEVVGLAPDAATKLPNAFSGGQRQRINLARALVMSPAMIVADEPTSALDVSIQAQIVNLLQDVQRDFHLTLVFITHDLGLVRLLATRIAVMYRGRIVEMADVDALFNAPAHPYTQILLSSIRVPDPVIEAERQQVRESITLGVIERSRKVQDGCSFAPRCPRAESICWEQEPQLVQAGPGNVSACHFAHSVQAQGVTPFGTPSVSVPQSTEGAAR